MAIHLSESLSDLESVSTGDTRLHGYSLASQGHNPAFVRFMDGPRARMTIVVPAGETKELTGLHESFPEGLGIEALESDGKIVANVFYEDITPVVIEESDA